MNLTRFLSAILIPACVLLAACGQKPVPAPAPAGKIAVPDEYASYGNGRFSFSIDYPAKLLTPQGEAGNGDGQTFLSSDGNTKLAVWGMNNAIDPFDTIKTHFAKAIKDDKKAKRQITLKVQKENWYVLSGFEGEAIFYRKVYLVDDQFLTMDFTYPKAQREQWDAVATRLEKSFKPEKPSAH